MNLPSKTLLAAAISAATAAAAQPALADDAVTIYSSLKPGAVNPELYRPVNGRQPWQQLPGYAVVRHDRSYEIERGISSLRVSDVAALIDPTTVTFTSLDVPDTRVLEQNFQFDLVSQQRLLERFIGQPITVELVRGEKLDLVEGTLLGVSDGLTLEMADGSIRAIRSYHNIRFPELPGGLNTRPTLEWLITSPRSGEQDMRLSYETEGMTWWADYNLVLDESKGCQLDLSSWVSIINRSGASYQDARLKLIAGDVHRAEMEQPDARGGRGCGRRRLPGEGILRISPVHAGPPHRPARPLDQADRTAADHARHRLPERARVLPHPGHGLVGPPAD